MNTQTALDTLRQAVKTDPAAATTLKGTLFEHAVTLRKQGDYAEAEALVDELLAIGDQLLDVVDLKARLLTRRGAFGEAERLWVDLLQRHPDFAEATAELAALRRAQRLAHLLSSPMARVCIAVALVLLLGLVVGPLLGLRGAVEGRANAAARRSEDLAERQTIEMQAEFRRVSETFRKGLEPMTAKQNETSERLAMLLPAVAAVTAKVENSAQTTGTQIADAVSKIAKGNDALRGSVEKQGAEVVAAVDRAGVATSSAITDSGTKTAQKVLALGEAVQTLENTVTRLTEMASKQTVDAFAGASMRTDTELITIRTTLGSIATSLAMMQAQMTEPQTVTRLPVPLVPQSGLAFIGDQKEQQAELPSELFLSDGSIAPDWVHPMRELMTALAKIEGGAVIQLIAVAPSTAERAVVDVARQRMATLAALLFRGDAGQTDLSLVIRPSNTAPITGDSQMFIRVTPRLNISLSGKNGF
jgi:tetratricopeptide (TPR) repeat protein